MAIVSVWTEKGQVVASATDHGHIRHFMNVTPSSVGRLAGLCRNCDVTPFMVKGLVGWTAWQVPSRRDEKTEAVG